MIDRFAKETEFANNSFMHLFVILVEFPKIEAPCRLPAGSIVSVYLGTIDYSARCAGSFPKLAFLFYSSLNDKAVRIPGSILPAVVSVPFAALADKRHPLTVKNFDSFAAILRQRPAGIAPFDDARRSVTRTRGKSVAREDASYYSFSLTLSLCVIKLYIPALSNLAFRDIFR